MHIIQAEAIQDMRAGTIHNRKARVSREETKPDHVDTHTIDREVQHKERLQELELNQTGRLELLLR
ncbi:unnamed protein product [Strongylus vulgaris]|uniref:Uncharacterized protein n=1 Tax=Strongylus vulgaris TaxID=40348 RepID=A0A3P7IYZ3_STRVU|nr:unnamed protein product [Strongylus vulgaris]